jgi:hypothetical protein
MNRREFLQSLAALGISLTIPLESLAKASESVIDTAWQDILNAPATFYVLEYGALSTDAVEYYPTTRAELLGFETIDTHHELISLAEDEWQVANLVEEAMADLDPEENPHVPDKWQDWLAQADDQTVSNLIDQANDWITGFPNESDYERADMSGYSGRGQALRFFRNDFEYCDDFDIVIVEGDCPGSSYFAAELRMDIEEANAYAVEYGIPIRFAAQG